MYYYPPRLFYYYQPLVAKDVVSVRFCSFAFMPAFTLKLYFLMGNKHTVVDWQCATLSQFTLSLYHMLYFPYLYVKTWVCSFLCGFFVFAQSYQLPGVFLSAGVISEDNHNTRIVLWENKQLEQFIKFS